MSQFFLKKTYQINKNKVTSPPQSTNATQQSQKQKKFNLNKSKLKNIDILLRFYNCDETEKSDFLSKNDEPEKQYKYNDQFGPYQNTIQMMDNQKKKNYFKIKNQNDQPQKGQEKYLIDQIIQNLKLDYNLVKEFYDLFLVDKFKSKKLKAILGGDVFVHSFEQYLQNAQNDIYNKDQNKLFLQYYCEKNNITIENIFKIKSYLIYEKENKKEKVIVKQSLMEQKLTMQKDAFLNFCNEQDKKEQKNTIKDFKEYQLKVQASEFFYKGKNQDMIDNKKIEVFKLQDEQKYKKYHEHYKKIFCSNIQQAKNQLRNEENNLSKNIINKTFNINNNSQILDQIQELVVQDYNSQKIEQLKQDSRNQINIKYNNLTDNKSIDQIDKKQTNWGLNEKFINLQKKAQNFQKEYSQINQSCMNQFHKMNFKLKKQLKVVKNSQPVQGNYTQDFKESFLDDTKLRDFKVLIAQHLLDFVENKTFFYNNLKRYLSHSKNIEVKMI